MRWSSTRNKNTHDATPKKSPLRTTSSIDSREIWTDAQQTLDEKRGKDSFAVEGNFVSDEREVKLSRYFQWKQEPQTNHQRNGEDIKAVVYYTNLNGRSS